ncbi:MAG: hypothetical protein WCT16_00705 [Candidatus Buchananbacteria bacterium]
MKPKPFGTTEFKISATVPDESKKAKKGELILPERLDDDRVEEEIGERVDLAAVAKKYYEMEKNDGLAPRDWGDGEKLTLALVRDLARLILELKDKLADYDTIISDDASGRLPSLFFRKIINRQKKKSGQKGVKTFFASGGQHEDKVIMNGLREFFTKNREQLGKVLLVTEYIDSGFSISRLIDILQRAGVDFDLAAVSLYYDVDEYKTRPQLRRHLRYGGVNNGGLYFYSYYGRGVVKTPSKIHPIRSGSVPQQEINNSRKNISYLADQLAVLAE